MSTPTQSDQQLITFLRTRARTAARESLGDMRLLHLEDKVLTIGAGTQLETRINKRSRKHLAIDVNAYNLHLNPVEPQGYTRFDILWRTILRRTETALLLELQDHLDIPPKETSEEPDHPDLALLNSPKVRQAVRDTARELRDSMQSIPIHDPTQQGTKALHDFLGPRKVALTLAIVGPNARVTHLQALQDHRHVVTQLHSEEPNALTIWFRDNEQSHPRGLAHPDRVLMQAKNTFIHSCYHHSQYSAELRSKEKKNQGGNDLLTALWETFRHLDTRALQQTNPLTPKWETIKHYVRLSDLSLAPWTPLPPWVQEFLLKHPYYLEKETSAYMVRAFIEESRAHMAKKSQRALTHQLHTVAALHRTFTSNPEGKKELGPLAALLNEEDHDQAPSWPQLIAALPRDTRKRTSPPPTKPRHLNNEHLIYINNAPHYQETHLMCSETLHLRTNPGKSIALYQDPAEPPICSFKREDDGKISYKRSHTFTSWQPREKFTLPGRHMGHTPYPMGLSRVTDTYTASRVHRYITETRKHLGPFPKTKKPLHDQIRRHLNTVISRRTPEYAPQHVPYYLVERDLIDALHELVDHDLWQRTIDLSGEARITQYNALLELGHHREHLASSNPGALTWALTHLPDNHEPLRHPGQFIAIAKQSLLNAGLDPRNWRFAATIPAPTMIKLAGNDNCSATLVINAGAQAQAIPQPDVAAKLASTVNQFFSYNPMGVPFPPNPAERLQSPLHQTNMTTLAALACKESARILEHEPASDITQQDELAETIPTVKDYVNHLTDNGIPLRSTTWNGLSKSSNKWHREEALRRQLISWQQHLDKRNGAYMAWRSAIGTTTIEGYTITPLTDEKQLHFEAIAMNHCVDQYGPECAKGTSRIFSVRKDGQNIATSELKKTSERWHPMQTRAKHNYSPPKAIHRIMEEVTRRYQEAESKTPPKRPKFRWIKEQTARLPVAS